VTRLFEVAGRESCVILDAIEGGESFEPSEVTCHYSMRAVRCAAPAGFTL